MIGRTLRSVVRWAVRQAGPRNLLLFLLLLTGASSVALGVADRVRGVEPTLAMTMAFQGVLAGWLVSVAGVRAGVGGPFTAVVGVAVALCRVGRLAPLVFELPAAWTRLLLSFPAWVWSHEKLVWSPLLSLLSDLEADAGILLTRIADWAVALTTGVPRFDPVAVAFVWSAGLWGVSSWAGWLICRRRGPLWALAPAGVLLMVAFTHVWGSHVFLLLFLFGAFLLQAVVSYDRRTRRWEATDVDYPELELDTVAVTVFVSLSLVALAQFAPPISVQKMARLAREMSGRRSVVADAVADSLGMEERTETGFAEVQAGGLPRRHLIGTGRELSQRVVMIINTGDLPVEREGSPGEQPPLYAWRSHAYDRYTGAGWRAGEMWAVEYPGGTAAFTKTLAAQRVVRHEVQVKGDVGGLLYAAGTVMVADHNYQVAWRSPEDPFGATVRATSYVVDSLVPVANEEQLGLDGSDYPGWVRERYLSLPESVPERVQALARDLTATEPTPYGRARAIEAYVRQFAYTLDVPVPPVGVDVVDYFLFDLQKGYCDYFGSAMTVLARAAGLPARLAVGYASGTYDRERARYVVTEADAHAWPEVYFPSHGWVRFEPTAGFPSVEHTDATTPSTWAEPTEVLQPARSGWAAVRRRWWQALGAGVALLALAAAAGRALDRRRLIRAKPAAALGRLYARLRRYGRPLKVPMRAGDTPNEFGASFSERLRTLAQGRAGTSGNRAWWSSNLGLGRALSAWLGGTVSSGAEDLTWLTGLYARASYSRRPPDAGERARAVRLWGTLRWRLLLARLWQQLPV